MKKVLLHICCGSCACYPYQKLKEENFEVTGYWYNPNIHPYQEYQRRLMAAGYFAQSASLKLMVNSTYPLKDFLKGISIEKVRCNFCYRMRMEETAKTAREKNFDCFTTTLLYSKFQQHSSIKRIGEELSKKYGVNFYYEDFRNGWKEGIAASKKMGLYRQSYCGCIFSETERYKPQITQINTEKRNIDFLSQE